MDAMRLLIADGNEEFRRRLPPSCRGHTMSGAAATGKRHCRFCVSFVLMFWCLI